MSRAKATKDLNTKLQHIQKATSVTHTLRNAMLCVSQSSSELNNALLLNILTPQQTVLFLQWSRRNTEKCTAALHRQSQSSGNVQNGHNLDFVHSELQSIKSLK